MFDIYIIASVNIMKVHHSYMKKVCSEFFYLMYRANSSIDIVDVG